MPIVKVDELIEAGVHFGHRVSRWNPKMEPYIFGKRNTIHIINLRETIKGLVRAYRFLSKVGRREQVLFVGTKRQARRVVKEEATRCSMPYCNQRWLGGTLTNYQTVHSRLERLKEMEKLEETGELDTFSKKDISRFQREKKRILRNLEGVRTMGQLPGALVVVDPRREIIAVREANKLSIPVVALLDTDSDPDMVDIPIPGNDDAMRSIQLVLERLANAVIEARVGKVKKKEAPVAESPPSEEAPPEAPAGEEARAAEETRTAQAESGAGQQ
ncbi:MAG: 30S ribosomal protein S2 [Planctomycetota bacterium]